MNTMADPDDQRIRRYISAAEQLKNGNYQIDIPLDPPDAVGQLGQMLNDLAQSLESRYREIRTLTKITTHLNAGLLLDDILDHVYTDFRPLIPYDRIGFAMIEKEGSIVRARWARTDLPHVHLKRGFAAPLAGSSLETIVSTATPRIINDLEAYLVQKPESHATQLIVAEGLRASLTCPLIANGVPIGFIFFSSSTPGIYANAHVDIFTQIAEQLSVIVEKGHLVSQLAAQKLQLEQQNEELQRLNRLRNTFLGMAAHDLRSPLSVIHMTTTILRHPKFAWPEAERQRMLGDVHRNAEYMLKLLNDLLDLTHIESGTFTLTPVRLDLDEALNDAVERHALLAAPKHIMVMRQGNTSGAALADPLRLRQMLDNLISNAVKFSPSGTRVTLACNRSGQFWRITITDQGPGISTADQARLFQQFTRLSARPTGGEKSSGLGLAITRQLVEALDGQIGVESVLGAGATFWFTLPIAAGEPDAMPERPAAHVG
ncbi:MAG TPA: ATP-binding protein [Roseiflexaceae bacterium]|nr:ATP-binding protein [Roseiflexaceae bacterium]HMP40623.1 ATP-binding protein [Roseiflexaceae bacterium]